MTPICERSTCRSHSITDHAQVMQALARVSGGGDSRYAEGWWRGSAPQRAHGATARRQGAHELDNARPSHDDA